MNKMDLAVFKRAKEIQSRLKNGVVRVTYKNYKGLSVEIEPVELAVIKSSLGLMAQTTNSFLSNVKVKYGY